VQQIQSTSRQSTSRQSTSRQSTGQQLIGKCFMHPLADYLLIGGFWSIPLALFWLAEPGALSILDPSTMVWVVLISNSAHFAASTVRLYSKPTYLREFSFLAFGFPAVTLAVLGICIAFPAAGGKYLQFIYLTWAPFHYAKQVYGLSMMYSFRSGIQLDRADKRLIYWVSMLPFLYAFVSGSRHMGLGWLMPGDLLAATDGLSAALDLIKTVLTVLIFGAPLLLWWRIRAKKKQLLPLIIPTMLFANGLWWTSLNFLDAFVVATIGHGFQYLAIMLVYHVREKTREPGNTHGPLYHAGIFYAKCLALGYALFNCWPFFFVWAGAGYAESMLMVIATINLHHFIVDAYIWRLRIPANQQALTEQPSPAVKPA
jgi:hypothetical protein